MFPEPFHNSTPITDIFESDYHKYKFNILSISVMSQESVFGLQNLMTVLNTGTVIMENIIIIGHDYFKRKISYLRPNIIIIPLNSD